MPEQEPREDNRNALVPFREASRIALPDNSEFEAASLMGTGAQLITGP